MKKSSDYFATFFRWMLTLNLMTLAGRLAFSNAIALKADGSKAERGALSVER